MSSVMDGLVCPERLGANRASEVVSSPNEAQVLIEMILAIQHNKTVHFTR
jgi:hypothetical protein